MKKIMYGVISFCLVHCLAAFGTNQDEALARINDVHLETQQLHNEIDHLRRELNTLKHRKPQPFWRRIWPCGPYSHPSRWRKNCEAIASGSTEAGFTENTRELDDFARMWGSPQNLLLLAAIGSTVTTSPFLGLRSAFDASDLIVNLPTMNEDLRFLKEHLKIQKKLDCYGIQLPNRPIIELGGKIEGIFFVSEDWNQGPARSDIDIGSARLDILVEISKGVHGFMALNMDTNTFNLLNNSNLSVQLAGGASRVFNSRVFVSRAFITVGDLSCSPLYFTIGQMFVPFGRYASNMVTSVLTVQLARTNERALLLGIYKDGFYGSAYTFRGESNVDSPGLNQGGVNLGFEKSWDDGSLNLGGGYIANIADATGMQVTGNAHGFLGFGLNAFAEHLNHRVPAYDLHAELALGKFNVFAEYISAEQKFYVNDLSFNGQGAEPSASNFEVGYNFKIADCPASLAVGYGTTTEALALGLPRSSFITAFNISIWKDTIESFEFRHDNNYDSSDYAGGLGAVPSVLNSVGGSRNSYTAQIGVYF